MKKIRGNKLTGAIIHIYMEISQGNFLCSYLYLKQAKMSCFPFHLFSFFFYKTEQKGGTGPEGVGGVHKWEGGRRLNRLQKMCTHAGKQCESTPCIAILISTNKNSWSFLLLFIFSLQQN
jgi:hypothetical protein